MKRIRLYDMWQSLCRTSRKDWARGWGHRYIGIVEFDEYSRTFRWCAWTYHTPRTRASVVVLARYTLAGHLRVVRVSGLSAAQVVAGKELQT